MGDDAMTGRPLAQAATAVLAEHMAVLAWWVVPCRLLYC